MISKTSLTSKATLAILVLLFIFLGKITYNQYKNRQAITKEKQSLIKQSLVLEQKNQELSQTLSYLNTPDFKERVARQQLNLKKEGEVIYNFSQSDNSVITTGQQNGRPSSNAQKWWQYFFK